MPEMHINLTSVRRLTYSYNNLMFSLAECGGRVYITYVFLDGSLLYTLSAGWRGVRRV